MKRHRLNMLNVFVYIEHVLERKQLTLNTSHQKENSID